MIFKTFKKPASYLLKKFIYNGICILDELLKMIQEYCKKETSKEKQEELLDSLINALRNYKQRVTETKSSKHDQEELTEDILDDNQDKKM